MCLKMKLMIVGDSVLDYHDWWSAIGIAVFAKIFIKLRTNKESASTAKKTTGKMYKQV